MIRIVSMVEASGTDLCSCKRQNQGFTVLEVLITVAIIAILLVAGIPALDHYIQRQKMSASIGSMQSQLAMARSEAIHFNTHIIVCPGNPESGCLDSPQWENGWMVFSDFNADRELQPLEPVHRVDLGVDQLLIRTTSGRNKLRFLPNGSAPGNNGSMTFCDRRGPDQARKLVISNMGRIRRDDAPTTQWANCPAT